MHDEGELARIRQGASTEEIRARSERLRRQFGRLYDDILAILDKHDPIGIGMLPDEYEPETETILLRLKEAHSVDALRTIVHEEFAWWFANAEGTWEERQANNDAGPEERYEQIAQDIWKLIQGGVNGS